VENDKSASTKGRAWNLAQPGAGNMSAFPTQWVGVIVLFCLGGATISGIGVVLSLKRIVAGFRRVAAVSANGQQID
jgi:hypothetical protein